MPLCVLELYIAVFLVHVIVSLCFHPFDKYGYNVTPQCPTSTNVLSYTPGILLVDPLPLVFPLFTLAKFLAMMHDILLRVYGGAQLLPRSLLENGHVMRSRYVHRHKPLATSI